MTLSALTCAADTMVQLPHSMSAVRLNSVLTGKDQLRLKLTDDVQSPLSCTPVAVTSPMRGRIAEMLGEPHGPPYSGIARVDHSG